MAAPSPNPLAGVDHSGVMQWTEAVTPSLSLCWGVNPPLRDLVCEVAGDPAPARFATLGWTDDEGCGLAVVLSGDASERVYLSAYHYGVRLCRAQFLTILQTVFDEAGAPELGVRVRPQDHAFRDVLRRLGFRLAGTDGTRHHYTLRADALPPAWRRARLRRAN